MDIPKTRWARTQDGADIAYQDFGQGPMTLVVIHGWVSHLEFYWEQPRYERFMRRLSAGTRVLVFDKRGIGMSDRLTAAVDLGTRMDDVRAVMDAADVKRAALLAWGTGGPAMAAFFAATHPERTVALCIDPFVQCRRKPDWPYGSTEQEFEVDLAGELAIWGEEVATGYDDPPDDPGFAAWDSKLGRFAATPASYEAFARTLFDTDVTDILPAIRVPTLVLAKEGSAWANPDAAAREAVGHDRPGPRHLGKEWFEEVALIYRDAHARGDPPTLAVAEHFRTSYSTAARWVGRARHEYRLLPKTRAGKARSSTKSRR